MYDAEVIVPASSTTYHSLNPGKNISYYFFIYST